MFSKIWTMKSTENYSDNIKRLQQAIHNADAILIGAGAGLSASAGYTYDGVRFQKYFADFNLTVTVTTNRKTKCTKCC